MTAWRIAFPDQTIRWLDILSGKPSLLAVWTQPGTVVFFDLRNGARIGERIFVGAHVMDRQGEAWRAFVATLTAPNNVVLPTVHLPGATVHATRDGRMRLIQQDASTLYLEVDGREARLDSDAETPFVAVALERQLGLIVALDTKGRMHVYQQSIRLGIYNPGLSLSEELRPGLAVAQGGVSIFVSDGERVILTDPGGRARKLLRLHYPPGALACSPDGKLVAISDADVGVIRVYSGATLTPTHQRFAADLLSEARRVSALTTGAPAGTMLGPLALSNRGVLAFATSGMVCVSAVKRMSALPRV